MPFKYTIYELTLAVPFPCPMLAPAAKDAIADVTIVEGPVPESLDVPIAEGQNWQASPGRFLFRGGIRAGRLLVEGGQQITLHRNQAAEDERLCANLLATVIAALMRQRGHLVLHSSVVMTRRGAIAISGESGAGKSTTQAALMSRGCSMVSDDITVLRLGSDGQILVLPGVPKLNLCEDAAIKLGHDILGLRRNPLRNIKVVVPVDNCNMVSGPVPLKSLYMLGRHSGKNLILTRMTGAEKFIGQQDCIYGPLFPEEHRGMFSVMRALAEQIEMIRIERPDKGCSVDKIAEAIQHG